ncbi:MAG TPA: hypothetical protein P5567_10165 [Kiritimatiellia bacterium]|nr:hypothetical protein [Kiritimatiellia bacterium]HRZ12804.1 hypothetical protein [Kiritimatiellia bacterium]HSA18244.1 hypothetical protein [Kiritimatiellia bacterium]
MAEQVPDSKPDEASVPPRIKLNGNGKTEAPPRISLQPKQPGKSETSRIELGEARPADPMELAKKMTARIDAPKPPVRVISEVERLATAKTATQQFKSMTQQVKSATAPISKAAIPDLDAAKKQTARIDLQEVLGSGDEDIFKRRTAILDPSKIQAAEAAAQPKTIRIKRPEGGTGPIKPVSEPMKPAEPVAAEARKSETARIELPADVAEEAAAEAPTRRKTIRIKRPEGGGAPMAIRPMSVSQPATAVTRAEPGELPVIAPAEEGPGAVYSILAIAALLVACVLIYVLAAQVGTVESLTPPHMPFPGGV